ncbi:MAG: gamma-glutamyltransferase family protein [Synechococcus sp.]
MNLNRYPYASRRSVVMGRCGAVATAQPLAAMVGATILAGGGNAVDAAVAMAIALTVLEPTANGLGSDAFALVWDGRLHGLNGSGRSPQVLHPDVLETLECKDAGQVMPLYGWPAVTVPGAVSAWQALWKRWGSVPFHQLCGPAIRYAREGFPVSPQVARLWRAETAQYAGLEGPEFRAFRELFFAGGRSPKVGEVWSSLGHARTLQSLAETEGESFYRGEIAEAIVDFSAVTGGTLSLADLDAHRADWVEPIGTQYRDVTVWELPPNGQGVTALMALNILEGFELGRWPRDSVESVHLQVEAMKLAFADAYRHVADPVAMQVGVEQMLDKGYAGRRRGLIGDRAIQMATPGLPEGGTVYLAAADGELMVSLIQSNFRNFGSGIVVPETGISLQNRGSGFSLDPTHPNCVTAGKRPFHTIIPSFLTRDGVPLGPMGVMGAHMQPQGHVQMVVNLVDYGMNPQAALDAPRWCVGVGNQVSVEQSMPGHVALGLEDRGHAVTVEASSTLFGKGQMIFRGDESVLIGASEPRGDGMAIAF